VRYEVEVNARGRHLLVVDADDPHVAQRIALEQAGSREPDEMWVEATRREGGGSRVRYVYLGTRWTAPHLVGRACDPVRRPDGRVIREGGSALVIFEGESTPRVVSARRLRLRGDA